jgi:hypothetical protein
MKIMRETTVWEGVNAEPNHIYIFERYHPKERVAKVIAYVPFGTEPVKKFKQPLQIDLKGRTFQEVA